jgi:hypothetical protein
MLNVRRPLIELNDTLANAGQTRVLLPREAHGFRRGWNDQSQHNRQHRVWPLRRLRTSQKAVSPPIPPMRRTTNRENNARPSNFRVE